MSLVGQACLEAYLGTDSATRGLAARCDAAK